MSVSFSAIAVIGCRVNPDLMKKNIKIRGCSHTVIGIENVSFCHHCGKPIWIERQDWIFNQDRMTLEGLEVVASTDFKEIFVCGAVTSTSGDEQDPSSLSLNDISDTDTMKSQVKLVLDKYGLWNEHQWGLWAVAYISY